MDSNPISPFKIIIKKSPVLQLWSSPTVPFTASVDLQLFVFFWLLNQSAGKRSNKNMFTHVHSEKSWFSGKWLDMLQGNDHIGDISSSFTKNHDYGRKCVSSSIVLKTSTSPIPRHGDNPFVAVSDGWKFCVNPNDFPREYLVLG